MDGDNLGGAQDISLCIAGECAAETVSDASGGVYQRFLVDVAPGEILEFSHALGAGSPSGKVVVQGVFFDPQPEGSSCAAKVCAAGPRARSSRNLCCSGVRVVSTTRPSRCFGSMMR